MSEKKTRIQQNAKEAAAAARTQRSRAAVSKDPAVQAEARAASRQFAATARELTQLAQQTD
jgi:hypothetical protein